jgi:nicotinamide-nucleotide amidase
MPVFPNAVTLLAEKALRAAAEKRLRVVTAESCTGGLVSGALTSIIGASDVFDRGFVTYSNDAKMVQLSVDRKTLLDFGAVSGETALEMAEGALRASHADVAVSITGIAGPDGGTPEKPVGLVYISVVNSKNRDEYALKKFNFTGDRASVRLQSVEAVLALLTEEIGKI